MTRIQKLVPDKIIFPEKSQKQIYRNPKFEPPYVGLRKAAKSALKMNVLAITLATVAGVVAYVTEKPVLAFINACTGIFCLSRIPSILKNLKQADYSENAYKTLRNDFSDAETVEFEEKFEKNFGHLRPKDESCII